MALAVLDFMHAHMLELVFALEYNDTVFDVK